MSKPFVIYRSSAGSGKTYALTREYLKLAFREPAYFKYVLAVTFTNKATKEMKVRILSVLEELRKGDHPIASDLEEATGLSSHQVKERAGEVLSAILHNYSAFSVTTIDSFFQKVIRAFAREMGLQGGFRIELDEERVLTEVIDKVLLEVGRNEKLTDWLIRFAETKVEDGKPWDTRREMGNLAKEIFKEQFKTFEPQVLAYAGEKDFMPAFMAELTKVKDEFENTLKKIGHESMEIIRKHGLDITDFSYKEGGPAGYLEKIAQGKIFEPGIRVISSSLDVNSWSARNNPLKAKVKTATEDGLIQLLQKAVEYYRINKISYESAVEVLRYLYTYGILSDLTEKLQDYREENELMLISDAAVFLKQIISDTEAPFIYEKVGNRFRHYLIDEFQDTSGFQWDNFRPLVKNSLAENNYNMVVGDVKQAIYRWRGGDLDLLLENIQDEIGKEQTQVKDLTQNWRSRQNIVDFNNSIFRFGSDLLSEQVENKLMEVEDEQAREKLRKSGERIKIAYGEVIQDCARKFASDEGGYLKFQFYPFFDRDGVEWRDNALLQVPRMIEELQDNKYELRDIAILVRTRLEGRAVVDHLLEYQSSISRSGYKYDVISSESLYLENSSVTRFLIASLKYIYKPHDAIQRVHMSYEYHQYIKPGTTTLNEIFERAANQDIAQFNQLFDRSFFDALPELRKKSMYELVEELIRIFELENFQEERAYLQGFMDAVVDFSKTENDDILSFLSWWEVLGKERTVMVSEEQNAIRVMTIHMAKGLQFKAVLVPFCEWNLDGFQGFDNILWSHNDEVSPFREAPYLPLNYSVKLKNTVFYEDFYHELIRSYLDNLNILYVAFTRAEEVLMACCPQHKNKGEIRASSAILDRYFGSEFMLSGFQVKHEEDVDHIEIGTYPSLGVEEIEEAVRPIYLKHFPSFSWQDRLTVKREFTEVVQEERGEIDPGVLIEILKDLRSISHLDQIVNTRLNRGIAHQTKRESILKAIKLLFENETVAAWFRPSNKVAINRIVLTPDGGDHKIDRIIYGKDSIDLVCYGLRQPDDQLANELMAVKEYFLRSAKKVNSYLLNVATSEIIEN